MPAKISESTNALNWFEIPVNNIDRAPNNEQAGYMAFIIDTEGNRVGVHSGHQ